MGSQITTLAPLPNVWVIANYKETQLTHMAVGEKAEITVDTFPGHTLHGHLLAFAPASGAQFALLPPDNATGNFTKIVQRVAVKILIDDADGLADRLVPGMSVEAKGRRQRQASVMNAPIPAPDSGSGLSQPTLATPPTSIPWFGLVAVLMGTFISTLNGRLSNFGLADIRGAVGAGFDEGAWVTTAQTAAQMLITIPAVWMGAAIRSEASINWRLHLIRDCFVAHSICDQFAHAAHHAVSRRAGIGLLHSPHLEFRTAQYSA